MQRSYIKVIQKVGFWNIKTKIYQTIKGLIILFIKFQFYNQIQQAFWSLRTSNSNLDLKLSLNSNSFIICIISDTFVLFPIYLFYDLRPSLH